MRKLICKKEFPHLFTIMATWSKTKQPQEPQYTYNTNVKPVFVKTSLYASLSSV